MGDRLATRNGVLLRDEACVRSLLGAINNVVVILGEDHRILEWNREAERVYGWPRDEVVGKDYLETCLPEEVRPVVAEDIRKVFAGGETRGSENAVVSRDGTLRFLRWSVATLHDREGRPIAVVASGQDITEQKRSRELVEQSEAELQAIVDNSPVVLCVKDLDGRITRTNRLFDENHGLPRGSAAGRLDTELLPVEVARETRVVERRVIAEGQLLEMEVTIPTTKGMRAMLSAKFPLRDPQGRSYAVCTIGADITDIRRAEAERTKLQGQIIEAQREALRELSTPLLPIAPGVVLMPLVGAIDEGRSALVLEALLQGVVAHQAAVAILDITGVRDVDAGVAMGLVRAAQAAGMLGAEVVLTGVRPAAAQALVELGVDLRGVKTLSSLEQGVAYGITRSGRRTCPPSPRRS